MSEDDGLITNINYNDIKMNYSIPEVNINNNAEIKSIASVIKTQSWCDTPVAAQLSHYLTLVILGLLVWALLWSGGDPSWRWDGQWSRMAAVVAVAWGAGLLLQELTALPPLLAALATGILARNLCILDMSEYPEIDITLRKIYPVVVLGKLSLGIDTSFMRQNWLQVGALGCLPWIAEVATVSTCSHLLLGFPWTWGALLGSIYASVTCAIVMPPVKRAARAAGAGGKRNWPQLVCTSWGLDTLLSVGVFGVISTYLTFEADDVMKYLKVFLTIPLGLVLGVAWGSLVMFLPNQKDLYVTELRVLFVLLGGLVANFISLYYGWGGAGGVGVLACNATAATHWARRGWPLNDNPAATAYRVLWSALEPTLFAFTGTFFLIDSSIWDTMIVGLGILAICLSVRLTIAALVCWDMTLREKLFVCCTWIPKSIVEAVLCPMAMVGFIASGNQDSPSMEYAQNLMRLIIEAIIITTPAGFLLTKYLGPILLKTTDNFDIENGGVGVLACNATAATHWARRGWPLNDNPAATAYRVLWSALEPTLFAFTGTFFLIDSSIWDTMIVGLGILAICLSVRLTIAALVCWDMTLREKLFVCCTWIPKSIVEAVLCPMAMVGFIASGNQDSPSMEYAQNLMRLIIEAIIITTPAGFLLTKYLGPILLKTTDNFDIENADTSSQRRKSVKDCQEKKR